MNSKTLKLLSLALVTAGALIACSDHPERHGKAEPPSPYEGLWLNADAYLQFTRGSNSFCNDVRRYPLIHGTDFRNNEAWGHTPHPEAYQILANGDVYDWLPTLRLDDSSHKVAVSSHVNREGFLVDFDPKGGPARLDLVDAKTLHVTPQDTSIAQARDEIRVDERTMMSYYRAVEKCVNVLFGDDFGGGYVSGGTDDQGIPVVTQPRPRVRRRAPLPANGGSDGPSPRDVAPATPGPIASTPDQGVDQSDAPVIRRRAPIKRAAPKPAPKVNVTPADDGYDE